MNYIRITCEPDLLDAVLSTIGVFPHSDAVRQEEPGLWLVPAEATDQSIVEVEALGATVEVIMNNQEFEQHIADVYADIAAGAPGQV